MRVAIRRRQQARLKGPFAAQGSFQVQLAEHPVLGCAEREIDDGEALFGVFAALDERLDEDDAYRDLERLPLRETVERLCADLQLTPDWSRWDGEAWTPQEPFFRSKASIWRRPSRKPLLPPLDAVADQAAKPRAHCLE